MCLLDGRFWQASEVPFKSLWDLLSPFSWECGVQGALGGVGGWEVLLFCLTAEPGRSSGRQPAFPLSTASFVYESPSGSHPHLF